MADQSDITTALAALGASLVTQAANSFWQWRRSRAAAMRELSRERVEARRVEVEANGAVVDNLLHVVKGLTADIARLRGELEEERTARRRADEAVRQLRIELDAVQGALQRCGPNCEAAAHLAAARTTLPPP